jgi:hypothetical protein
MSGFPAVTEIPRPNNPNINSLSRKDIDMESLTTQLGNGSTSANEACDTQWTKILTEAGQLLSLLHKFGAKRDTEIAPPPVETRKKPRWIAERRELWFGNTIIKRFRTPAANQETLLTVFEEENWTHRIDDPFPSGHQTVMAMERLRSTVKALNQHHVTPNVVRFEMDGTGQAVLWTPVVQDDIAVSANSPAASQPLSASQDNLPRE